MKYLKILLFPLTFPAYILSFILSSILKATEKLLSSLSKLPDIFVFLFTLACGMIVYFDISGNNYFGLVTDNINDMLIRVLIGIFGFFILTGTGILICKLIWFPVLLLIKLVCVVEKIIEFVFYGLHRYYKKTVFVIKNIEYAYTKNNIYDIRTLDTSKFKIIKVDNKNLICPLSIEFNR